MVKRGGVSGMQFEAFHFLRSFCGKRPESRSTRTLLDLCSLSPFATIQMHIRFLYLKSGLELPLGDSRRFCAFKGFRMVREQHSLAASLPSEKGKHHSLLEHRLSFSFHGLLNTDHPSLFTLIILGDTGRGRLEMFEGHGIEGKPMHVECSGRAAGLRVFQGMVWAAVEKWQKGWLDVLDFLDNELSVSVSLPIFNRSLPFHCPLTRSFRLCETHGAQLLRGSMVEKR